MLFEGIGDGGLYSPLPTAIDTRDSTMESQILVKDDRDYAHDLMRSDPLQRVVLQVDSNLIAYARNARG